MQLPENVVPMPAEMRAELKRLAAAATPGPWRAVPWIGAPPAADGTWPTPDKSQWRTRIGIEQSAGDEKERSSVFYGDSTPWGSGASLNDAEYIAAASPDVALATLAYVEALEAEVASLNGQLVLAREETRERLQKVDEDFVAATKALSAAEARTGELQAELAERDSRIVALLAEFAAGIQPADIPACLKMHSEPAFGEFLRGVNSVHGTNLRWVRWKAAEMGIAWPLPHAEFEFGYTPDEPGAALPSSPAAAGPGEASRILALPDRELGGLLLALDVIVKGAVNGQHTLPDVCNYVGQVLDQYASKPIDEPWRVIFPTRAAYDASAESVAARIESGEIQPREPDEDEPSQLPWNPGFTPKCHGCGLPSHAKHCTTEGCPAKPAGPPTTGEGGSRG